MRKTVDKPTKKYKILSSSTFLKSSDDSFTENKIDHLRFVNLCIQRIAEIRCFDEQIDLLAIGTIQLCLVTMKVSRLFR